MIVAASPETAEQQLLAGELACPTCPGKMRPHGWARRRTVRGPGTSKLVVTPRRARCPGCGRTQVILPGELLPRRADTTEVIGQALVDKACGAGWRTIAIRTGRPASTVRRWLRAAREKAHLTRLYQNGIQHAVELDRETVAWWNPPPDLLTAALEILLRAAEAFRRFRPIPLWSLVHVFAGGFLLAPQRR